MAAMPERPDLLPQPARWTDLPADVQHVVVDRGGRAWFELAGAADEATIKTQVEAAAALKAPYVSGADLITVDAKNRLWLRAAKRYDELLCYDITSRTWSVQRAFGDAIGFRAESHEAKDGTLYFAGWRGIYTLSTHGDWTYQPMYDQPASQIVAPLQLAEDPDGVVYAWGSGSDEHGTVGVWRRDGDHWTQFLTKLNGPGAPGINAIAPIGEKMWVFTQDPALPAFPMSTFPDKPLNAKQFAADVQQLGNPNVDERKAAQERLLSDGWNGLPALRDALAATTDLERQSRLQAILDHYDNPPPAAPLDGHTFGRVMTLGPSSTGKDGAVVLWTVPPPTQFRHLIGPNGRVVHSWYATGGNLAICTTAGKLTPLPGPVVDTPDLTEIVTHDNRLLLGMKGHGISRVTPEAALGPLTVADQANFFNIVAEDGAGKLFISDDQTVGNQERSYHPHFAMLDPSKPDTRATLAAVAYPVNGWNYFAIDSTGRPWAKLAGRDHPFLSVFENGAWTDIPSPRLQPFFDGRIQPLTDGGILLNADTGAALFDHQKWTSYPTMDALVEANLDRLRKTIDDHAGTCPSPAARLDAAGNIWVIDPRDPRAYTGAAWVHLQRRPTNPSGIRSVARILPINGAKRMLLVDIDELMLADIQGDTMHLDFPEFPAFTASSAYEENAGGLFVDSAGHSWIPGNGYRCYRTDGTAFHEIEGVRDARLEDHAHRIWFASERGLSVLLSSDKLLTFPQENLFEYSSVAEDKPDSLWVTTTRGLAHFAVSGDGESLSVKRLADYTAGLPRSARTLFLDGNHTLWTTTTDPTRSLWHITLPP